jgi:F0F1-type ATP synthase assembly protein I
MADPNQTDPNRKETPPMVLAAQWLARTTTVASEMALCGFIGYWLDRRFGTEYLMVVGALLGVSLGLWHLIRMTRDLK